MSTSPSDFDELCDHIERLVAEHNIPARVQAQKNVGILTVYGPGASALRQAKRGLADIEEMAQTAAEHHPYWRLLNSTLESLRIILDNWEGDISEEDLEDIRWAASSLSDAIQKQMDKSASDLSNMQ